MLAIEMSDDTNGFGIIHKYSFLGETGKKLAVGTPL